MCISGLFGGGASNALAAQQLQIAQTQQQQAAAAIAASKGDTEASRDAAETQMRKAAVSNGFASTVFGAGGGPSNASFKALFGA